MAPRVEVPCAASRGPLWRRESRSLGTKWKPKNFEFLAFIDPSGQNQLYHTPLLSKIWDLNDRKKIVNNPFNCQISKKFNQKCGGSCGTHCSKARQPSDAIRPTHSRLGKLLKLWNIFLKTFKMCLNLPPPSFNTIHPSDPCLEKV